MEMRIICTLNGMFILYLETFRQRKFKTDVVFPKFLLRIIKKNTMHVIWFSGREQWQIKMIINHVFCYKFASPTI